MLKNKRIFSTGANFFLISIIIGVIILKVPICTKNGINLIDAIFEATSAVSSTGSSTVNLSESFTFFGQFIIMLLIEIGTIGFLVLYSIFFKFHKKRIKLSNALILSDETNVGNFSIIKQETFKIIYYTLAIQFFGSWLLALRFIPIYGPAKGLWYSIFHSISAYCNAGFDIIGNNSFVLYRHDLYINVVIIALMFLGSIGFFVLEDLWTWFKTGKKNKIQMQSKLILKATFIIITLGTVLIKIFNPSLSIIDSLFTVITSRSTGFSTIDMSSLPEITKMIITLIMFVGGGPASNAGGVRVMVIAIIFLTVISDLKNNDEIVYSYRSISPKTIRRAITILIIDTFIVITGTILLSITDSNNILDLNFYTVSSFSNTGLSTIDISSLSTLGKCISIFIMYLGKIAPITFLSVFITSSNNRK